MFSEFKKFILKGNVVDLSTGVIIGAAFSSIVKAFTDGIVKPILQIAGGNPDVTWAVKLAGQDFDFGMVINAVIGFLITAAVIFFVIIKPFNYLMAMLEEEEKAAPAPEPTKEEVLLSEIRDLLAANQA